MQKARLGPIGDFYFKVVGSYRGHYQAHIEHHIKHERIMNDPKGNPSIEIGGIENIAGHTSVLQLDSLKGLNVKVGFDPLAITGVFSAELGIKGGAEKSNINFISLHYNGLKLPYKLSGTTDVVTISPDYSASLHHLAGSKYKGEIGASAFVGVASPELEGVIEAQAKVGINAQGAIGASSLVLACLGSEYYTDIVQANQDEARSIATKSITSEDLKKKVGDYLNAHHQSDQEHYPLKVEEKWWCKEYKTNSIVAACCAHKFANISVHPLNSQSSTVDTDTAVIINEIKRLGAGVEDKHEASKNYITLTEFDGSVEGSIGAEAEVSVDAAVGEMKFKGTGSVAVNLASADYAKKYTRGRLQQMIQPLSYKDDNARLMHTQDIDMTYTNYGVKALSVEAELTGVIGSENVKVKKAKSVDKALYELTYSRVSYISLHTYWRTRPTIDANFSALSGNSLSAGSSVSLSYLDAVAKKISGLTEAEYPDDVKKFVAEWTARLKIPQASLLRFLNTVYASDALHWISDALIKMHGRDTVFIECQYLLKQDIPFEISAIDNKLKKTNLNEVFVESNLQPRFIHLRASLNDSYTPKNWKLSLGVNLKVVKLGVDLKSVDKFVAQQLSDLIPKTPLIDSAPEDEWELPVATPMLQSYVD